MRRSAAGAIATMFHVLAFTGCATRAEPTWEGLELVERTGLDMVYVKPGIDLSGYRRVMLDPVEVSFDADWDPRGSRIGLDAADPQARVVDEEEGQGLGMWQIANRVTNTAEVRQVLEEWADMLRTALDRAREESREMRGAAAGRGGPATG